MNHKPVEITDLDMAFGGKAMKILPPYSSIPEDFKSDSNKFNRFVSGWFYKGLLSKPRSVEGIDLNLALGNIKACLVDFQPKHEHKIAGSAYLASQWLIID